MEYEILPLTVDDEVEAVIFFMEFFLKEEPLNKCLRTADGSIGQIAEKPSLNITNSGPSLKAVHNNQIIGICLNDIFERDYLEKLSQHKVTDPIRLKIFKLVGHVKKESNIFARFPDCDKAMSITQIAVHGAYRGQGIAKELIRKTRDIAKQLGCGFITVDCTSHFTALALRKLGFELQYSLRYADYKENGEVVFKPEAPHESINVYIKKFKR